MQVLPVCRCAGVQVCRCAGVQVLPVCRCYLCAGATCMQVLPVCRCYLYAGATCVQVCRCAGVQVCRCAGVQVCRCAGDISCRGPDASLPELQSNRIMPEVTNVRAGGVLGASCLLTKKSILTLINMVNLLQLNALRQLCRVNEKNV